MNNSLGDRVEKTLAFKEMLERRTGLEVVTWDERLTTVEANRTMIEAGIRRRASKEYVEHAGSGIYPAGIYGLLPCRNRKTKNEEQSLDGEETADSKIGSLELMERCISVTAILRKQ